MTLVCVGGQPSAAVWRLLELLAGGGARFDYHGDFDWGGADCPYCVAAGGQARSRLFPLIQQVNDDHVPVRISSKGGDAVLMSAEDFDSWQETIYLLRSPANARRLMEAVARDRSGQSAIVKTLEDLEAQAGE
jgi:antitoxin YefM